MHNEFLLIDGGKMSKSLNNIYRVEDLEKNGLEALSYRYLTFTSHYRNKLNFTWEAIKSANNSLLKARKLYNEHLNSKENVSDDVINEYLKRFEEAINDDLNMPKALSIMWEVLRGEKSEKNIDLLNKMDSILSLDLGKKESDNSYNISIPDEVNELLNKRKIARENKDFALSDSLRDEILKLGYVVIDSKEGQKVKEG